MPVRQQTESSDSVEEQVKVAARLYEEDLRQLQTVQERRAATQAAEEMGIPAAYMERASTELAARQTARAERRRRRRASIAVAAVAVTATVGAWGISHRHTAPPTPLVYNFAARSQGQWHLGASTAVAPTLRRPSPSHRNRVIRLHWSELTISTNSRTTRLTWQRTKSRAL